jgi:hypothetical protein
MNVLSRLKPIAEYLMKEVGGGTIVTLQDIPGERKKTGEIQGFLAR